MADRTPIEWTDATVNAVNGCSVLSPGCTNCYAMRLAGTRMKHHPSREGLTIATKAGPVWNGEVRLSESALLQPLRWRRPRRIFWNAHGDLFHDAVPDEWIDQCFAVMALTPRHSHQVLTKRSARMREYLSHWSMAEKIGEQIVGHSWPGGANVTLDWDQPDSPARIETWPLPNVWLGVSAEDQTRWDERVDDLRKIDAAVRFVSAEPLLGEIRDDFGMTGLHWVIAGGESGPGARPMHPDWARSLRDQCAVAGVPFLFKQWGEWRPFLTLFEPGTLYAEGREFRGDALREIDGGCWVARMGKKAAGRLLDGVQHDGMPA